jgi:hypothetical protein
MPDPSRYPLRYKHDSERKFKINLKLIIDHAPGYATLEGGGSSRAVIRLHTMIGLTLYRTHDHLRIRRALYRLNEKA